MPWVLRPCGAAAIRLKSARTFPVPPIWFWQRGSMKEKISLRLARRIVLAAQGFAEPKPAGPIDRRHLKRVLARLGLFQIDSVSVLVRAHYMPLFSRLGPYPLDLLDDSAVGRKRLLFEYWAHEASLLPVETYPLMRWRMRRAEQGSGTYGALARFARDKADYVERVFREIEANGPIAASGFDGHKGSGGWWGWSDAKHAFEWLFWAGRITTASREGFQRYYDLPERVLPKAIVEAPEPPAADAHRELLRHSARALGVATDSRPARLFPAVARRREGAHPRAGRGRRAAAGDGRGLDAAGLSAPGCAAAAQRPCARLAVALRSAGLGALAHRAAVRLPLSHRDLHAGREARARLLRAALPARRHARRRASTSRPTGKAGVLQVLSAFAEPGAPPETAAALIGELRSMASWLGLERVEISRNGDLAPALADAATV